jgi:hypothetical protein
VSMPIRCGEESVRGRPGDAGSGQRFKLIVLKLVHTLVWIVMTTANFAGFYLAFIGTFNSWFYFCVALLGGEIVVILANSWHCPLTDVMAKYTDNRAANFDIYLPEWLARNNIRIFSGLITLEIMIVLFRRMVIVS